MSIMNKLVGVIGGMGPMATAYFQEMVVDLTDANCDQENVDMVITNRCSTYDRTDYILGKSENNPVDTLIDDAKKLEKIGANILAITCNTAHYFYNEIQKNVNIQVINMIEKTTKYTKDKGYKKVCILGTKGTIYTNLYQKCLEKCNIDYMVLNEKYQNDLMDIIYNDIKAGNYYNIKKFENIISYVKNNGCDCVILGCTELSILKNKNNLDGEFYIDSLETLAREVIKYCGKDEKKEDFMH